MDQELHSARATSLTFAPFWDALAQHHAAIEDNFLDVKSVRRILRELKDPVLIVGAGQGLIVAEVRKNGFHCDGVDLSPEMIRYAKLRRDIDLIHADAQAMPIPDRHYGTVIYATGVVDFTDDDDGIRRMLEEGRRVIRERGRIFVAFCRLSPAQEGFIQRVGLLNNHSVALRESLELYLLNPAQMVTWVTKHAGVGYLRALSLLLRMAALTTIQEKKTTLRMQKIVRQMRDPNAFINAAPQTQPYRNEAGIGRLFKRLGIPVERLQTFASCFMVLIQ